MSAKGAFDRQTIHDLGSGPALRRLEHDERPARPVSEAFGARLRLDRSNVGDHAVESRGHELMHPRRILARHEVRVVPATSQVLRELLSSDPREHGWVGNPVAVQVQDTQHRSVGDGIQELVAVPPGGERASLRLAVPYDAGDEQIRVLERRPIGVAQRIAELSAFVDDQLGLDVLRRERHAQQRVVVQVDLPDG